MGRPRRDGAVLARGDGREVPPPRPVAALGSPAIAYAEGRCVGGSTEINSGLYHRLPHDLATEWRARTEIDEFTPERARPLRRRRSRRELSVAKLPGAPPPSSAVLERGATKLGWRAVEFARVFRYDGNGPGHEADDGAHVRPRARSTAGAAVLADCRVDQLLREGDRIVGVAVPQRTRPTAAVERAARSAPTTSSCAAARSRLPRCSSAAASGPRIGCGLKLHPTIKIAARFPHPLDHGDVPMHRVTEFAPNLTIGGSVSRRGPRRARARRRRA